MQIKSSEHQYITYSIFLCGDSGGVDVCFFSCEQSISVQYITITTRFTVKHNQWASIKYQNCLIQIWYWCFSAITKKNKQNKNSPMHDLKVDVKRNHLSLPFKSIQYCPTVDRVHSSLEVLSINLSKNSSPFILNIESRCWNYLPCDAPVQMKNTFFMQMGGKKVSHNRWQECT